MPADPMNWGSKKGKGKEKRQEEEEGGEEVECARGGGGAGEGPGEAEDTWLVTFGREADTTSSSIIRDESLFRAAGPSMPASPLGRMLVSTTRRLLSPVPSSSYPLISPSRSSSSSSPRTKEGELFESDGNITICTSHPLHEQLHMQLSQITTELTTWPTKWAGKLGIPTTEISGRMQLHWTPKPSPGVFGRYALAPDASASPVKHCVERDKSLGVFTGVSQVMAELRGDARVWLRETRPNKHVLLAKACTATREQARALGRLLGDLL